MLASLFWKFQVSIYVHENNPVQNQTQLTRTSKEGGFF